MNARSSVFMTLAVLTCVLNVIVWALFIKDRYKKRYRFEQWLDKVILNLSVSDFGFGFSFFVSLIVSDGSIEALDLNCKILSWFAVVFLYATSTLLCSLAYVRYRAVVQNKKPTMDLVYKLTAVNWGIGIVGAFICTGFQIDRFGTSGLYCTGEVTARTPLTAVFMVMSLLVLLGSSQAIMFFYYKIYKHFQTANYRPSTETGSTGAASKDRIAQRKILFISLAIIGNFYTWTFPAVIRIIWSIVINDFNVPIILDAMSVYGLMLNALSNPIVYFVVIKKYRIHALDLLCCSMVDTLEGSESGKTRNSAVSMRTKSQSNIHTRSGSNLTSV